MKIRVNAKQLIKGHRGNASCHISTKQRKGYQGDSGRQNLQLFESGWCLPPACMLYTDNLYASPALRKYISAKGFGICGKPAWLEKAPLKKGEIVTYNDMPCYETEVA